MAREEPTEKNVKKPMFKVKSVVDERDELLGRLKLLADDWIEFNNRWPQKISDRDQIVMQGLSSLWVLVNLDTDFLWTMFSDLMNAFARVAGVVNESYKEGN